MMNETDTTSAGTAGKPVPSVWPLVNYDDAHAGIRFLVEAFGFVETLVVPGDQEGYVAHAELRWPEGGGVMVGTGDDEAEVRGTKVGAASVYVVTDTPDALFERATAAGAKVLRGLRDEDYGSRGFTVADPEGNIWSFGTYYGT
jgi:uncharacterized glyoxalase superfamily protein PhnB